MKAKIEENVSVDCYFAYSYIPLFDKEVVTKMVAES